MYFLFGIVIGFGKNTFIYRLLMLPTNRLNIYLAKATTILLFYSRSFGYAVIIISNRGSNFSNGWFQMNSVRYDRFSK